MENRDHLDLWVARGLGVALCAGIVILVVETFCS